MSVLVTGAAGFIGSHVAAALRDAGEDVVALDDLSGGERRNVPGGASREGSRPTRPFPGIEIEKGLPEVWRD